MDSTDQSDKEEAKCPHGMEKFNRMAQVCNDCRLKKGKHRCPEGIENREEKGGEKG